MTNRKIISLDLEKHFEGYGINTPNVLVRGIGLYSELKIESIITKGSQPVEGKKHHCLLGGREYDAICFSVVIPRQNKENFTQTTATQGYGPSVEGARTNRVSIFMNPLYVFKHIDKFPRTYSLESLNIVMAKFVCILGSALDYELFARFTHRYVAHGQGDECRFYGNIDPEDSAGIRSLGGFIVNEESIADMIFLQLIKLGLEKEHKVYMTSGERYYPKN